MSMQDPISDMLTRIRNAQSAKFGSVTMPGSNMKASIAKVMKEQGYIEEFKMETVDKKLVLDVKLKYYQGMPVIANIKRCSRPGLRVYKGYDEFPVVKAGLGISIVSTSKGVMTGHQAKQQLLGGEVICVLS